MLSTVASAMCANPTTTIQITVETWQDLNSLKTPGDTFDDVIQQLLQSYSDDSRVVSQPPQSPQNAREQIPIPDSVPDRFDHADVRDAIEAAITLVLENNGASMREIVTTVGQEHPLDYEIPESLESGERFRGAWWRKVVKPALEDSEKVRKPKPHESEWQPV